MEISETEIELELADKYLPVKLNLAKIHCPKVVKLNYKSDMGW